MFYKMSFEKIFIILFCTLVLVPVCIGVIVSSNMIILNTESQWIGFWGSYLGALIGATVSACITIYSVKHADERNEIHRIFESLRECQNAMYKMVKDIDYFKRATAGYTSYVLGKEVNKDSGHEILPANKKYLEIEQLKTVVREDILILKSRIHELSYDGLVCKEANKLLDKIYDHTEKTTILLMDLSKVNKEKFDKISENILADTDMINDVCTMLQDAFNEYYAQLHK